MTCFKKVHLILLMQRLRISRKGMNSVQARKNHQLSCGKRDDPHIIIAYTMRNSLVSVQLS